MTETKQQPKYRVLVIDDELDHCEMIEECLGRGGREAMSVEFAHTVKDACRRLQQEKFSFILLDHNLPDGHGSDILERMEERLLTTPVIGLSTSSDPQVALADFRGGAIEFMTKHEAFKGDALRRRVIGALSRHKRRVAAALIESHRERAGIAKSDEELMAAARTDSLMGILNRAAFDDVHGDLYAQARTTGTAYGLCMVDVDHFKLYNDTYGHVAGDEALRKVAEALRSAVRPSDIVARYGGEEIVALLNGADDRSITIPASRMVERVAAMNLLHEHNDEYGRVTVSVGAAALDPSSGETVAELIERADQALYRAKAEGRNRAVVAPPRSAGG